MKKVFAILMALILSISCSFTAFAFEQKNDIVQNTSKDANIQRLLDERAGILSQTTVNVSGLNDVDLKLSRLGVEFLTEAQVNAQFPAAKAEKELALSGNTVSFQPFVVKPSSNVNSWLSYRANYSSGGRIYNVQRLIAQPRNNNSALTNYGSRTVQFSTNWMAGFQNVVSSAAWSVAGLIPGTSIAISFYDAIDSFFSGISKTTEVDVPHIVYSYASTTTAVFTYVRLDKQSDDYQWLSLISTKTNTEVAYQIPTFTYKNSSGKMVLTPKIVTGRRSITATPSGYDSISQAISSYNSTGGGARHNAVSSIRISGPENKTVQTISPCYPQFPLHCE